MFESSEECFKLRKFTNLEWNMFAGLCLSPDIFRLEAFGHSSLLESDIKQSRCILPIPSVTSLAALGFPSRYR